MKSMKSLTMKQRLKVCAIMLWRVLFELSVDIPIGVVMYLILLALAAFVMLFDAICHRDEIDDDWAYIKNRLGNTFQTALRNLRYRFNIKILVNEILEKEFPDEEEP